MALIEIEELSKSYHATVGVTQLNLECHQGEIFGFLGPNGSGKTTTIRLLVDLIRADQGQIRIFGLDSHQQSRQIHARLGNLPGGFAYDKRISGRQLLATFAHLRGMADLGSAEQLADRLDVDLERRLGQLSRGNLQKIGLIQALFHQPQLLILDEPTTGLDPLIQQEVLNLLDQLRNQGVTIFLSSHELDEVEKICDRTAIIRQGRLVAIEDVGDLHSRALRHFVIGFADQRVDLAPFEQLAGVSDIYWRGSRLYFSLTGPSDQAIKLLGNYQVDDIEIAHPSLEELFLAYYQDDAV